MSPRGPERFRYRCRAASVSGRGEGDNGRRSSGVGERSAGNGVDGARRCCWSSFGEPPERWRQTPPGRLGISLTQSSAVPAILERPRLGLPARKRGHPLQEADEVDRVDLRGGRERSVQEEGPPRAGGEPPGPGAASHHRLLARREATVERANLAGNEKGAREEVQQQGVQGDFAYLGQQPRRRDLRGLPIGGGSGTTRSGTTVWIPACFSCAVRGECSRRVGAQAPLLCGARGCTVRHGRREAPEAAVQVDPGLRATEMGLRRLPNDGEEGRLRGLCYP